MSSSTKKKAEANEGKESRVELVWLSIEWMERMLAYSKENTDVSDKHKCKSWFTYKLRQVDILKMSFFFLH